MKIIDMKILTLATILALAIIQTYFQSAHCAPNGNLQATNNNNNNNNKNKNQSNGPNRPINFLRGLFRRQTSSSAASSTSTDSGRQQSSVEAEGDEAMSQTELDAQKFMETLPNVNNNDDKDRPNSFRERVSGTFGVLRDGVSNQFKTMRENWSDTIEDLRDTWSNSDN